jgi:hypothetical protein
LSSSAHFRNAKGELLTLYKLVSVSDESGHFVLKFSLLARRMVFEAIVSSSELDEGGLTIGDLKQAPSFAVRTYPTYRILEFISGRKKAIVSLRLQRLKPFA